MDEKTKQFNTEILFNGKLKVKCANLLIEHLKNGTVEGIESALNDVIRMERNHYLEQHPNRIYFSTSDNRYRTYLPPKKEGGKRKPITAKSKENLEKKIIAYYRSLEEPNDDTFEKLFPRFIKFKGKESSLSNARKLEWVWNTFYAGEEITKLQFGHLTVAYIKEWLLDKIEQFSLTKKEYVQMKSLLNMMFDYAVESSLCAENPSRMVARLSRRKFAVERKKDLSEQVYVSDEMNDLVRTALEMFQKTHNIAYYGICLNCCLALRVSECVALKVSDFTSDAVHIQRREVDKCVMDGDGHIRVVGHKISDYLKSPDSERTLTLSDNAKTILGMLLDEHEKRSADSDEAEFLFLDEQGKRIHRGAIEQALSRCNGKIKTMQKANHCIRKTCLSNIKESGLVSDEELRIFAGHADYATTARYYIHSTFTDEERAKAFFEAIDAKINAFQGVQNDKGVSETD